ncbi:hypothetical protein ABRQ05_11665 [Pectobacterium actinidiae]|uniref:hypothetical protein n=1 Tax=Pectobacterium actinidiae TaxID=1507808 RepID=UPI0032ECD763
MLTSWVDIGNASSTTIGAAVGIYGGRTGAGFGDDKNVAAIPIWPPSTSNGQMNRRSPSRYLWFPWY